MNLSSLGTSKATPTFCDFGCFVGTMPGALDVHPLHDCKCFVCSHLATLMSTSRSAIESVEPNQRLRRRELNPGLPRDRRKYSPLYYSGHVSCLISATFHVTHCTKACLCSRDPTFLFVRFTQPHLSRNRPHVR